MEMRTYEPGKVYFFPFFNILVTSYFTYTYYFYVKVAERHYFQHLTIVAIYFRVSSLPVRFWDEFYKGIVNSPALHPLPFLQIGKYLDNVAVEAPSSSKRFSLDLPLMPYYVQKLTVSEEDGKILRK